MSLPRSLEIALSASMRQTLEKMVCFFFDGCRKSTSGCILTYLLGPPTQGKQYEKLLQEESLKELAGIDDGVGDAHFINTGMRLERDQ